jgi:hypothetical protein
VLGGDVFKLKGRKGRPPVVVNMDLVDAVAGDAVGVAFLACHVEGIISTDRHLIELGNSAGRITIQCLFAPDLGTIERGIRVIKRAKPKYVKVLPALAYPLMASRHPEVSNGTSSLAVCSRARRRCRSSLGPAQPGSPPATVRSGRALDPHPGGCYAPSGKATPVA